MHRRMTIRRRDSIIAAPRKLTPKEVRGKIVEEILNTEKAYVQQLEDIIEVGVVLLSRETRCVNRVSKCVVYF